MTDLWIVVASTVGVAWGGFLGWQCGRHHQWVLDHVGPESAT